jgi:hypothetical protein
VADTPRLPRWAAAYLCLQAAAIFAWWLVLVGFPASRRLFFAGSDWITFLLPDMLVLALPSTICAVGVVKSHKWAGRLVWAVAGGALYALALDFGYCILHGVGWLGPILMLPTVLIPGYLCWRTVR